MVIRFGRLSSPWSASWPAPRVLIAWIIRPRETAAVLNAAQEFTAAIAAARDLVAAAEQMTCAGDMDPPRALITSADELGALYPILEAPQIASRSRRQYSGSTA